MKLRLLTVALAAGGTLLAACGGDDDIASNAQPAPAAAATAAVTQAPATLAPPTTVAPAPAAPAAGAGPSVLVGESALGQILTGPDGKTLYGFKNDVDGVSTCTGTCADAWPPAIVTPDWTVGPGLNTGIFNTVVREDGQEQIVAGKWPLYYFANDANPGDVTGQGAGDVWFVVGLDGRLIEDAAAAPAEQAAAPAAGVAVAETSLGQVLVDSEGLTLYAFTKDEAGTPTCEGDCATAWPPLLADAAPTGVEGVSDGTLTVVPRPDGANQLKAGKWPLYRFAGDAAPGDVNGQGSGGVWFAVAPDGKLIKEAQGVTSQPDPSYND